MSSCFSLIVGCGRCWEGFTYERERKKNSSRQHVCVAQMQMRCFFFLFYLVCLVILIDQSMVSMWKISSKIQEIAIYSEEEANRITTESSRLTKIRMVSFFKKRRRHSKTGGMQEHCKIQGDLARLAVLIISI